MVFFKRYLEQQLERRQYKAIFFKNDTQNRVEKYVWKERLGHTKKHIR